MAGFKKRGILTKHRIREHQGRAIMASKFVNSRGGAGVMVAAYRDTGDLVLVDGKPVHYRSI